jgi:putative sigma-54 modulation protein
VDRAASAHVILTVDKYRKIAEVTVKNAGQEMVAACESTEMITALHDALAKVEQQAIRHRQKSTTTMRHPRIAGVRSPIDTPATAATDA